MEKTMYVLAVAAIVAIGLVICVPYTEAQNFE